MNIFITGTSRGIGQYLAESLLAEGHFVYGCSSSGESFIDHGSYRHFKANVCSENEVRRAFREVRREKGYLDAVINNAGIASMNHFITTPLETVRRIMDVNYLGTFLVSREAVKLIKKRKNGRIVNFTTVAAPLDLEGEAVYASSKAAIEKLTRVLAKELGSYNITVNTVGPTPVETSLIAGVPKDKLNALLEQQALKRMGTKQDVYNAVKFFLDPLSGFITGQTLYLGGVF